MLGHRVNSEGLRGRANAPRRRRAQEDLYRVRQRFLSTFPSALHKRKRQFLPVSAICGLAFSPPPRALPKGYSRVCPKVWPRVRARVCTGFPRPLLKALDYRRIRHLSARRSRVRRVLGGTLAVLLNRAWPSLPHSAVLAVLLYLVVLGPHSSADLCTIRRVSRTWGKRQHHLSFSH